jgi:hypothetical protein
VEGSVARRPIARTSTNPDDGWRFHSIQHESSSISVGVPEPLGDRGINWGEGNPRAHSEPVSLTQPRQGPHEVPNWEDQVVVARDKFDDYARDFDDDFGEVWADGVQKEGWFQKSFLEDWYAERFPQVQFEAAAARIPKLEQYVADQERLLASYQQKLEEAEAVHAYRVARGWKGADATSGIRRGIASTLEELDRSRYQIKIMKARFGLK